MMSTYPENIKGGLSIIWKIENYHSIQRFWVTDVLLEWPDMKSKWFLVMSIKFNEANKKELGIGIKKTDKIGPFIFSGTISDVSGKFCFNLNQFDRFNFEKSEGNRCVINIDLEPMEYTDSKKQDFSADSVTIHINLWDPNTNDHVGAEYFIRSTYFPQTCVFQWMPNRSIDWKKNGEYTESTIEIPMAFTDFHHDGKKLIINFNLHIKDHETFASIIVKDCESGYPGLFYCYKLTVQGKEETNPPLLETGWSESSYYKGRDLRKIIEKEWDHLSTERKITIEFVVVTPYYGVIEKFSYKPSIQNVKRKLTISKKNMLFKNNLRECLHKSYKEGEYCDVVLHANNETFPCHKAVLCSRSPVFKEMFKNNMKEKENNVVNINDVESSIFEMFLNYLYLDNLTCENFDSAVKLYKVAGEYAVIKLQEECANIIMSSLSTENVCQALDLADSHEDEDLKRDINSYICEHIKEIEISSSWKQFLLNKPALVDKTLQAAITYKV